MQVGSSVENRYYTFYQTNRGAKYCACFTQKEDGKLTPSETTENPGFAEFEDYQEFHKAWMSQGMKTAFHFNAAKHTEAVSIAEVEDEGEFLGLTMVQEEGQSVTYGMRAMLSEKSTVDNPIVQVVSNLGGKRVIYNVEVNKVNPSNATNLEMFALLNYTDKIGITDGGTFGSHQQLEVYGGNASSIGYCGSLSGEDVFLNEKFDWTSIMEKMVQVYKDAGIENQAEDCKALFDFFSTYTKKNEVKENTAIDFSRFAPNASEEVKQAFMEAAVETGYREGERMDYLSQVFIHQVENRHNGVANYRDVFGSSIASALQAARKILYDLDNPIMPLSHRGENVAKYIEQEKQFYRAFIEKLEGITSVDNTDTEETKDYAKILEENINEIFAKIQNGDMETSYQIGAQSFTEKEWEEFIDKFDSAQEAIQELMKEEQARKEAEETRKEDVFTNDASTLLTTESTSCVYETVDPEDDDIRYITWYTEEGIFCRKAGQTEGYEWSIIFENKEQYDKVMEFIGQFPSDWNMRFAAHENFWNDFLNDEIDIEGFMEFINGTNKGVPDYSITVGDSMYIDKDKMQWAKYTNPLGARFYTAEEMHQMQMEIIAANEEKLKEYTEVAGVEKVSVESMLKAKYPNLVYNVGDATSSDWRTRNDYPFEALFKEGEKSTELIENWKPTGVGPKNQRHLAIPPNSKAVMIHPKAQERMENDPEFAKEVMERIESWWAYDIARNEAILPGCTIGMSQAIAIGEDGEIANVLAGGGSDTMRSNKQKTGNEEDEYDWWMERMARHALYMQIWLEGKSDISMNNIHAMQSGQSAEREIYSMLQNGLREKLGDTICGMPTDEVIQQTFADIDRCRGIRSTMMM